MAKWSDILGLNARSADYLRLNLKHARERADDKLMTKWMLKKYGVPHPELWGVLASSQETSVFDWTKLTGGFVIKPVQGFGGEGIMIIRRQSKDDPTKFILMDGRKVSVEDLKLHASDIIEGRYSHNNLPDQAMIEERIKIHPKFKKLAVGGAPDVRVIVFNRVPVMAMLRLPTEESSGKANLHQGAIGLGIDIATGITTYGVYKNELIKYFSDSQKKVNGITVPHWGKILRMAVETQIAAKLNYLSVDMLIDEEKGPVVLELNDQPGLAIQVANRAGLKKRLERVEGLDIDTAEKGVKIGRALFASEFANRVKFESGDEKVAVSVFDVVKLKPDTGKRVLVRAKIDTGAFSSSIDRELANSLGLLKSEHVLLLKKFKSALGESERPLIEVDYVLKGVRIKSVMSVTNRRHMKYSMIIGRRDLRGFSVEPVAEKRLISKKLNR